MLREEGQKFIANVREIEAEINTQCMEMWHREEEMAVHVENPS
jgi:hypothetical protein